MQSKMMMKGGMDTALTELVVGLLVEVMVEADPLAPMREKEQALTTVMVMPAAEVRIKENGLVLIMVVAQAQFHMGGEGTLTMAMAVARAEVLERTLITTTRGVQVPEESDKEVKMEISPVQGRG